MNSKHKALNKAKGTMGKQHHSKPVTPSDKIMNARHQAHRDELHCMECKLLEKSVEYNKGHRKEHEKAEKKALKALEKMKK